MMFFWRWLVQGLPWLIVGVAAIVITLLALAPAAWMTAQLTKASGGRIQLADPAGSLWHGSATLLLAPGPGRESSTLLPGRLKWHTAFWPLLTGRVRMRMEHAEAMSGPIVLDATRKGATLTTGSLAVPASLLTGLGAPFNTLDLQGNMHLSWTDMRLLNQQAYGQLTMVLTDVSSRLSRVKPLGTYRAVLAAQGNAMTVDLATLSGPLQLNGRGQFQHGHVMFQGTARAVPDERDNLAGLLNLLGRRISQDTYNVSITY